VVTSQLDRGAAGSIPATDSRQSNTFFAWSAANCFQPRRIQLFYFAFSFISLIFIAIQNFNGFISTTLCYMHHNPSFME
jgi:hypothetical protein